MDYNILIADFAGKNRICMTDTLYQYDYGQKLKIESIPALPRIFEAHFSNVQYGGVSITVTGMDGIVDIPNSLLMTGKRIYCWIYVTEPGSGETVYQILLPVQHRPMPEYYDVTDVGVFDSVVQQVGDYAATATAGATSATASAAAAATSASEAAASASAAESAKTAAETASQTATEKAQQTAQDAAQAALDAGRAESAAGRAEAAETGAESAKTDAETAAQGAADSASAASASATGAAQAATSAAQSATAAAGSATTAQGAAQTATAKAGEASASATAAAASETAAQTAQTAAETAAGTATASATTAATKAGEAAQSASSAAHSKTDAEAAATRAETAAASLTVDSALSDSSTNPVQNKVITGEITDVKSAIDALKIVDTASGAIASFPDGAAMPVEGLTVEMEPIQEGTGDPSPDNIRPISGRDSVTVMRSGKNLFDLNHTVEGRLQSNGTIVSEDLGVVSEFIFVKAGSYFASRSSALGWWKVAFYDASKTFLNVRMNEPANTTRGFIVPSDGYIRVGMDYTVTASDEIQIEFGSVKTDYVPGSVASVTIPLGQTVYGGTVDVTTGTMTVDRAYFEMQTAKSSDWQKSSSYPGGFYIERNAFKIDGIVLKDNTPFLCSHAKSVSRLADYVYGTCYCDSSLNFRLMDGSATLSDWVAYLQEQKNNGTPVVACGLLATPLTVQLTPAQLSTLKGQNNVWSDADSVTVEYVCDPKLYIERLTEPDADMVADANITSGHYFMVGNTLYLATANIASGANIVPGVNCTRTNLAAALNAINA